MKTTTYKCQLDHGGPYTVWKAPKCDWWTVCDRTGYNVQRHYSKPGAVFCDVLTALADADLWNGKDLI